MRSLTKEACPQTLLNNSAQWTTELLEALASGEKPTATQKNRYNQPAIKAALRAETHDKCAYCESKITHTDHGDIEHIVPKSKVPDLAFEWTNLTLACRICNQSKGDFYPEEEDHSGLVDPYNDNPDDHFFFYRETVIPRPDSAKGLKTDHELKLSRGALHERRIERMQFVDGLLRGYFDAPADLKPILLRNLRDLCCRDDREYGSIANRYVNDLLGKLGIQ